MEWERFSSLSWYFFYILFLSLNTWQICVRMKKVFEGLQAFLFLKKKFVLRKNYCVRKIYDYIKLKILGPTPTLAAFFYNSLSISDMRKRRLKFSLSNFLLFIAFCRIERRVVFSEEWQARQMNGGKIGEHCWYKDIQNYFTIIISALFQLILCLCLYMLSSLCYRYSNLKSALPWR